MVQNDNINLNLNINTNNSLKSLTDLKSEFRSLQLQMSEAGKAGNKELFDKLLKQSASVKDEMGDLKLQMASLEPDALIKNFISLGQTVTAAFSIANAGAQIFGANEKKVQEIQKQSIAYIQLIQGMEAIRTNLIEKQSLRIIAAKVKEAAAWALANPIIAITIALTAAVTAGIVTLVSSMNDDEEATKNAAIAHENYNKALKNTGDGLKELDKKIQDQKVSNGELLKSDQLIINQKKDLWEVNKQLSKTKQEEIASADKEFKANIEVAKTHGYTTEQIKDLVKAYNEKIKTAENNFKTGVANAKYYSDQEIKEQLRKEKEITDNEKKERFEKSISNFKKYLSEKYALEKAIIENNYAKLNETTGLIFAKEKELIEKDIQYNETQYKKGFINYNEYLTKKIQLDTELIKSQNNYKNSIKETISEIEKIPIITDKTMVGIIKIEKRFSDTRKSTAEVFTEQTEKTKKQFDDIFNSSMSTFNSISDIVSLNYEKQINSSDKAYEKQLENIEKLGVSEEEKELRRQTLEEQYYAKSSELKEKAAKQQKDFSIFNIITNTAVGIMKMLADPNLLFPSNLIASIALGVEGAAQLAAVYAAPMKFAKGGLITNGTTGTADDVPILASKGEFVMNAQSTQMNLGLLNSLNGTSSEQTNKQLASQIVPYIKVVNVASETKKINDKNIRVRNKSRI